MAAQINEGFQDDAHVYGIAEDGGEFAQDSKTEELDGPLSSEMMNEALKRDNESASNIAKFNDKEKCVKSVPFSFEKGVCPSENQKEELTDAIAITPNEVGFVEGDKVKYEEDAPFSAEVMPNELGFVEGDKIKYEEDAPFSAEKSILHGPSSQENSDESLEFSYLINDELLDNGQSEEKFDCCYDDDEMSIVNCKLSAEKIGVFDELADPDDNSKFEVDFEGAFGPNIKEFDAEDPWYHSSKTIENLGHSSEYHRFNLEKDSEFGEELDAVIEQYAKRYKLDCYDDVNVENPCNKGHFIEKNPIDANYDFEYDDDSDEEIVMKRTQKKKLKVVIRDRPVKNPILQKLFLYSDVDNHMYIRQIKDPLKRKDVVRSDITGFKHVPVWDSTNMKKYYSDGDLGRPPPDFSMAFSNVKE